MKRLILIPSGILLVASLSGCQDRLGTPRLYTLAFVIIAFILVLSFLLSAYTNTLRDEVDDCDAFTKNAALMKTKKRVLPNNTNPYSLSKVQFAAWTVIISSSYIYLSLCKGECADETVNKTALVLMGVGAGIATATTIIDKREISEGRPRHQNHPSQGFFIDILSDDNGISIHRFQNLVWTIIAMSVYLFKVSRVTSGCALPELSDTILALTGISGLTYVTLRTQENNPAINDVQESNNESKAPAVSS